MKAQHIPALDGLRGVAVLAVIGYHYDMLHLSGGFLGVDLFFVLSGFLITSLLVNEHRSSDNINFRAFWVRRFRRLMPASLLVLATVSIWSWSQVEAIQLRSLRMDLMATLGYVANWRFIASGQSYFDLFSEASPLRHAWSLAIEEQFYVVWPLIVWLILRKTKLGERGLLAFCAVAGAASTVLMSVLYSQADPSRSYYGTDTRAAQLLVGAGLAVLAVRHPKAWSPTAASQVLTASAIAIAMAFLFVDDQESFLYHGGFLAFALIAGVGVLASTRTTHGILYRLLASRGLRYVGRISYGLYLWHWPVQIAISDSHTSLNGVPLRGAQLLVTFACSAISFHFIESPIRFRTRWGVLTRQRGLAFAATSVIVVAGLSIAATTGAKAPPDYLTAPQSDVLSVGDFDLDSVPSSSTTATVVRPVSSVPSWRALGRTVFIGDSVAASLQTALNIEAKKRGLKFIARTRPGCGVLVGAPATSEGKLFSWSQLCSDLTPEYMKKAVINSTPDTIVWLSSWEAGPRFYNGVLYQPATPEFRQHILDRLDEQISTITANGAMVYLVTNSPRANENSLHFSDPLIDTLEENLNDIYRDYVAAHPTQAAIVNLASVVCPYTPCPAQVGGVTLRPRDGGHFAGDGPTWVAPRLLDLLEHAVPR